MRDEPDLASLVTVVRLRCAIAGAVGLALCVGAAFLVMGIGRLPIISVYLVLVAVSPALPGIYLIVNAVVQASVIAEMVRRPERVALVELATSWGRPGVRATLSRGRSATFRTGRLDRNRIVEELRSLVIARSLPAARIVERG